MNARSADPAAPPAPTPGRLLKVGPKVSDELFSQRFALCLACEHNVTRPGIPKGVRCQLVPCGGWLGAILRLARGRCPLGKWLAHT